MPRITFAKTGDWLRVESPDLDFFGRFCISGDGRFTVAYSRTKVVMFQEDTFMWAKNVNGSKAAKVSSNGSIVTITARDRPDILGGSLLVFDISGNVLLEREFESNLFDCNITADGEICFANTLAPDSCLYAIDVKSGNDLWSVKDVHVRAGSIKLDEMKKVIEIERIGLGIIKTVDFQGHPVGDLEEARKILTSATGTSESINEIASILDSPNRALVLEGLEKLKSLLRNRKISIDAEPLLPQLKQLYESGDQSPTDKIWALTLDDLLGLYERKAEGSEEITHFIAQSLQERELNASSLFHLSRLAMIDPLVLSEQAPRLVQCLKSSQRWNDRRWAAMIIGEIGRETPELVKSAVPIMIRYITSPEEVEERPLVSPKTGMVFHRVHQGGMEPSWMLKDACIDALGKICRADAKLQSEALELLREIASSDISEYSRKKVQRAIESIQR